MKKLMMALALVALTGAAHGQDKQAQSREKMSTEERAKMRTERMTKELGLTAEQATRVGALNRNYGAEAEMMRKEQRSDRDAKRAAFKSRKEAYEADLKSVLTPAQFEQWKVKKAEMKAWHELKHEQMREQPKP